MPYTRTVQTFIREGNGPPRVVTKTFTDDGDSEFQGGLDFGGRGGLDFGGRGFNARFGGRDSGMNIRFGGSRSTTGGFGTQRPQVCGRSTRKEKKNPFAGLTKQSYDDIVKRCKEEGILFEDPEFPAEDSSIFFSRTPPKPFEWKRPSEICDDPKWVSDGASRFDVQQGELGDCWLLAAVASLTCNQTLLHRVVPQDQRFDGPDYCGVFRFHFWHQGDWIEVVVDDRLPTYYNRLTFMHSTEKNEFWSALMEKAYAKLCGSYESLKGGSTCEAMEDFTGGVTESIDMKKAPPTLFSIMLKAYNRGSLMGCSIDADPNQLEAELSNGLVMGHAYSVTAVKLVEINTPRVSGNIPLIRVRNPWGNEAEWKGAWSDQSKEWQFISPEEKQNIGLTFDDDGEFWMSFDDFSRNFEKLEICNLGPDSLDEDDINKGKKRWEAKSELGEWIPRVNAGGCRNFLDTFAMNPQYRVTLTDPDDEDDDNTCTVLVGLLQKDRRKKRKEGLDMLTIGYVIYKLKDDGSVSSGPLDTRFFKYNASVAKSPTFINMREVCGRHKLPPGTYCIIPSTFEPNQQGEFLLRIFTEKASVATEMDESTQIIDDQGPGGNVPSARPPPPPTQEEQEQGQKLREGFKRMAGEDMEIDAYELQEVVNTVFTKEFKFDGFSIDICRSMVAMHDGDLSGKLGFDEFKTLWADLRKWKAVFKDFDKDHSGHLSSYELRNALNASGFRLSNRTLGALIMRYSNKKGEIEFDDFVLCAIRLKTMLETFKSLDTECQGIAAFRVDDFIQTTMYS